MFLCLTNEFIFFLLKRVIIIKYSFQLLNKLNSNSQMTRLFKKRMVFKITLALSALNKTAKLKDWLLINIYNLKIIFIGS